MKRGRWTTALVAIVIPVIAEAPGCSRPDAPDSHATRSAAADRSTSRGQELRPVALPDLSKTAASVQAQIRTAYSSLTERIDRSSTPAAERANAYGDMGKLLMAAEFGLAAESCFLNAQTLAPDDMRWPYYLGHLYKDQGATDKSRSSFERANQLRADDVATLIWLGEADLAQDRPDAAQPRFARARTLQPRNAAALAGLGRAALAKREYGSAVKYLEEALPLAPQAGVIHYSLAMAYRGLGDLAKAESHLQPQRKADIVVPDPLMQDMRGLLNSATAFESQGISALERGDSAAAAAYFRKGIELTPDSASLHHRLGTALFLGGDARASQEQFERALQLSPDFARAHYSLAVLLVSSGQYQRAIERLSVALKAEPEYVEARLLLGDILRQSGRPAESLGQYDRVIAINPASAEARLGHALALVAMGRYQEARDRLTDATKVQSNRPELIEALARVLAAAPDGRVRDGRLAVSLMQPLVAQQPPAEWVEALAMAYAETGEFQQAVAWQQKAIAGAEQAGRDPHVRQQMTENLRLFQRGEPCRTPWREGTMP